MEAETFQVELVWNREFDWTKYGRPHATLEEAIRAARNIENSGDGARVKKTLVKDNKDRIRWAYGKIVELQGAPRADAH